MKEGGSQRLCSPSKALGTHPYPMLRPSALVRSTPGSFHSRPPRTLGLTPLPAKNCHRLLSSKPEPSFVYPSPSGPGFLWVWLSRVYGKGAWREWGGDGQTAVPVPLGRISCASSLGTALALVCPSPTSVHAYPFLCQLTFVLSGERRPKGFVLRLRAEGDKRNLQ